MQVEKTAHPCQFPVELIERLILSMTNQSDWVLDPFMGAGSTAIAALMHGRKAIRAELMPEYVKLTKERIHQACQGALRIRPMERTVYDQDLPEANTPPQIVQFGSIPSQPALLELPTDYDAVYDIERLKRHFPAVPVKIILIDGDDSD